MTARPDLDVLVVGAGVAGLLAARDLADAGQRVLVVDKGRGVGGRLATRRIAVGDGRDARLDHGAQFFTARTARFALLVTDLEAAGVVHEWTRGFGPTPDGHPRYAVLNGMTALAKHLATDLDVRTECRVTSIRDDGEYVTALTDDGSRFRARRAIVTAPAPQAIELLDGDPPDALAAIAYDPTLCLLALLDRPLPWPGAVQRPADTPIEFLADNEARGTSVVPAVTVHLTGAESRRRWDDADHDTLSAIADMARPHLSGARMSSLQLKRWRYATPTVLHPEPMLEAGRLVFAGDAFGSPRIEGAATSGWAAATAILGR